MTRKVSILACVAVIAVAFAAAAHAAVSPGDASHGDDGANPSVVGGANARRSRYVLFLIYCVYVGVWMCVCVCGWVGGCCVCACVVCVQNGRAAGV
jgi:hypothetical protein